MIVTPSPQFTSAFILVVYVLWVWTNVQSSFAILKSLCALFLFVCLFVLINLFYLFIFGCVGSLLLRTGFL